MQRLKEGVCDNGNVSVLQDKQDHNRGIAGKKSADIQHIHKQRVHAYCTAWSMHRVRSFTWFALSVPWKSTKTQQQHNMMALQVILPWVCVVVQRAAHL
jgi:hypothetical protein